MSPGPLLQVETEFGERPDVVVEVRHLVGVHGLQQLQGWLDRGSVLDIPPVPFPPAAAPAASREGGPKSQLVPILIGAVCAGGARLSRVRSEFERLDAGDGVKRLVLQAVDPELLEAVVGPQLAPAWVKPLRAQYARFKQAYPTDWVDVEKV